MSDGIRWTIPQEQSITDRGGTILVSAAAGSGKTAVLVNRLIDRIVDAKNPVDVDRLLVMTFTNAAAAEMKTRVSQALSDLLKNDPHNTRLLRQQLALPRASISTVHSFCIDLLRNNSYLLDISPQFKIGEEQQLLLLRREALTEALSDFYREATPEFCELSDMLSDGKRDTQLLSAVETIYEFIQSYPHPEAWLTQAKTIYDASVPVADTVWGRLVLEHVLHTLQGAVAIGEHAAALCENDAMLIANYLPSLQMDCALLKQVIGHIEQTHGWDEVFQPLIGWKPTELKRITKPTDPVAQKAVKELRDKMGKIVQKITRLYCGNEKQCLQDIAVTKRLITVLYDIVSRFSQLFVQKKKAQNLLDFNDLEHYALQLLTICDENGVYVPSPLAKELSLQFEEIMVDEYQDTNETQNAIFTALSREETNLFYVGDVKQSIYAFRQARPEMFIERRKTYATYDGKNYPATITLGDNFRSRKQVTDTVNFLFRQLMSEEIGGLSYKNDEALQYAATYYTPSDEYDTECLIVNADAAKMQKLSTDAAEARTIAKRIRELYGTLPVTTKDGTRPARYSDFCILLRSKQGHAETYREELEQAGIPVAIESSKEFFTCAEIRLALSLLRCIDNPTLDIPLAAVLLSPLFGFTPDDVVAIRMVRPRSCLYTALCAARKTAPTSELAKRCKDFVAFLDRYRTLAATVTVDALLRRLYEETALPDIMTTRSEGTHRRENLQMLHEHCCKFEQNGFRGLSAFIRYVDRLQEQGGDLPAASASTAEDAVRIMSIHGSKGLEFPVVFLARLNGRFNDDSSQSDLLLHHQLGAAIKRREPRSYNRFDTLPRCGLSLAIARGDRSEEMRVLYVALTRAKEKLILVTTPTSFGKTLSAFSAGLGAEEALPLYTVQGASSYSDWILTAFLRHPDATELRWYGGCEEIPLLSAESPCHFQFSSDFKNSKIPAEEEILAQADPTLVEEIRGRMAYTYPHEPLSHIPSKLAASDSAHQQISHSFIARSRPAFLSQSGLTPTERGTAMHTFMQYAAYEKAAISPVDEANRLVNGGFLTAQQAAALDIPCLLAFFKSDLYRRMSASSRLYREFHFTCLQPVQPEEFTVVQGIADCVFEENGTLVIVDYKTDRVSTAKELIARYRPQLDIYRNALSAALDMPVSECALYSFALNRTVTLD